ncbi:MAG: HEAT repeat domain-containing protein [Lentisphaerae bacterium]|nr:HEAT repeat domain-containing protein [Lentisphaerota bacterium]
MKTESDRSRSGIHGNSGGKRASCELKAFLGGACVLACAFLADVAAAEPPGGATGAPREADRLAVEKTLAQLESADWMLKSEAVALLGKWQLQEAVPRLTAIVDGKNEPWLAGAALVALARISGSNVLARAAGLSDDPAPEIRGAATEALGIIGGAEAIAAVRRRLADADAHVRCRAAAVYAMLLGKDAWKDVAGLVEQPPAGALEQAARALGYVGTAESRARIEALLATTNVAAQSAVLFGLKDASDPDVVPLLLQFFAGLPARSELAGPCMDLLQSYGDEFLSGPLVAVFESGNMNVLVAASRLLYAHPTAEPAKALAAALTRMEQPPDELVLAALNALSTPKVGPARHVDLFSRYLTHRNPQCRARAATCLGLTGSGDLYPLLRPSLADTDRQVVRSALLALGRIPAETSPGEGIVNYLGDILERKDLDYELLRHALNLMTVHGKPEEFPSALAALKPILSGNDGRLRPQAAVALGQLGGQAVARQVAEAQGYVLDWMLIGTFLNDENNSGLTNAYPPEAGIDFKTNYVARYIWTGLEGRRDEDREAIGERKVEWMEWESDQVDGKVLLKDAMPPPAYLSVAYGVGDVVAPASKTVSVTVAAGDAFLLWLNGSRMAEVTNQGGAVVDFPATLKQGDNRFIIKTCNIKGDWWYSVQLREEGAAGDR